MKIPDIRIHLLYTTSIDLLCRTISMMCFLGCIRQGKENILHNKVGTHRDSDPTLRSLMILHSDRETNKDQVQNKTMENILTKDTADIPLTTTTEVIMNEKINSIKMWNAFPQNALAKKHSMDKRLAFNVIDHHRKDSKITFGISSSDAYRDESMLQYMI